LTPAPQGLRLDGVPLAEWDLESLRAQIGVVPQEAVIFSSSALENIRYGTPGPATRR
jgi:ATP-binding cassette subfamily B protein